VLSILKQSQRSQKDIDVLNDWLVKVSLLCAGVCFVLGSLRATHFVSRRSLRACLVTCQSR
jgi:hypothetical protein